MGGGERERDVLGVPGLLPGPPQPIVVIALADGERLNAWVGGADLLVLSVSTASSLRSAAATTPTIQTEELCPCPPGSFPW